MEVAQILIVSVLIVNVIRAYANQTSHALVVVTVISKL